MTVLSPAPCLPYMFVVDFVDSPCSLSVTERYRMHMQVTAYGWRNCVTSSPAPKALAMLSTASTSFDRSLPEPHIHYCPTS